MLTCWTASGAHLTAGTGNEYGVLRLPADLTRLWSEAYVSCSPTVPEGEGGMVERIVNPEEHTFRSARFKRVVREAVRFLNSTPIHSLAPAPFDGVGAYALYYLGTFEHYTRMAAANREKLVKPVYVGKAVPPGWRTARAHLAQQTPTLHSRLRKHARSIEQANNLRPEDFRCRFVILAGAETDLVTAIEADLIRTHRPLWNTTVDGFGNHDPGSGRYNQAPSEWDILHPGRPWVKRLTGTAPMLERIVSKVRKRRS